MVAIAKAVASLSQILTGFLDSVANLARVATGAFFCRGLELRVDIHSMERRVCFSLEKYTQKQG